MADQDEDGQKEEPVPLKIKDVMVREVITVDEESTVKEAVNVMNQYRIGSLIVLEKGKAAGIVTERDFLERVISAAKNPDKTRVKEIMTRPLVTVDPDADLGEAVRLMFERKIKKLAVVDAGKLVGIVTLTDIARSEPQMIGILKQLIAEKTVPKSMKKVIDFYVV